MPGTEANPLSVLGAEVRRGTVVNVIFIWRWIIQQTQNEGTPLGFVRGAKDKEVADNEEEIQSKEKAE